MSNCSHVIAEEINGQFTCSDCGKKVDARDAMDVADSDRSMDAFLSGETCRKYHHN